ncbi:drug/metabolite transporter (DMT)-like permease [Rhizobium pisi]|uniref:DMT family transporter n=1 Tax=Rhizobium pisi TaxID=574561 RepID=A0A427MYN3_9HYPH|nr:DMT family transporter [Rhizobium pisi]MBB3135623.1 drug/metabolite transporter (DMT)-like permease [Rhizobium pisi]RSB76287.1 DMT family transporter [Rhizobium pisi]TCA58935.1 DMT family transporter [Rhizobium pisi]
MTTLAFSNDKSPSQAIGYAGGTITVLIWATWFLVTRHSATTPLGSIDIGLIRFGIPAIALAPIWMKTGLLPKAVPLHLLAIMVSGSGAIFFLLTTFAIHSTPAASSGILLGGSMPLATALIGAALFRERPDGTRIAGLVAIVAGVLILLTRSLADASLPWTSFVLLPAGALLWASYTHAFRRSGLTAVQASALIAVWSFLMMGALAVIFGISLPQVPLQEIGLQTLSQGILSGLVAMVAYGTAVRTLGGTQAAAFTALTPVLATLGGGLLLGEQIGVTEISAAVITGIGVALSTGIAAKRR